MWQADVFTIFPELFPGTLGASIIGKALQNNIWKLNVIDLKKFPAKNDRIDSPPYGGGAGMVLSPLTFQKAFETLPTAEQKKRKIYFSPRGRQLNQNDLQELSEASGVIILCGRYEGVDKRILDHYEMEEVSIGDFVLLGGEVAALAILEGCVRLLPGVVGNHDSISYDSFQNDLLEYDQYTMPENFQNLDVPEILRSGNHQLIEKFRLEQSKTITKTRRKDLWYRYIKKMMLRD